jgi:hypothetical protein
VTSAYAASAEIDTTTQISASNVIYENSTVSQIASNNVQGALEEISLKLAQVMVGTWNIQNYNQEDMHEATGRITINNDGTFNLTAGSFAAIGMGSGTAENPVCKHNQNDQTYQEFAEGVIVFVHYNPEVDPPIRNAVIPRLVKIRQNELIFIGSGGCGIAAQQKVSILTRAQKTMREEKGSLLFVVIRPWQPSEKIKI